jgi:hypothetical protein
VTQAFTAALAFMSVQVLAVALTFTLWVCILCAARLETNGLAGEGARPTRPVDQVSAKAPMQPEMQTTQRNNFVFGT